MNKQHALCGPIRYDTIIQHAFKILDDKINYVTVQFESIFKMHHLQAFTVFKKVFSVDVLNYDMFILNISIQLKQSTIFFIIASKS